MNGPAPLRFRGGTFRIMAVGDLHEPFDLSDPRERRKTADTLMLLETALQKLRPDLVVFMGDMGKDDDEEKDRVIIRRILAPLKARGVPYALVFGNHDPECAVPLARQLRFYREEYDNLYITDTPGLTGCGNCRVGVLDGEGKKELLSLWFADSGCGSPDPAIPGYAWLQPDQIDWYRSEAAALKKENGSLPPAVWFMHIPVPEERDLTRPAKWYELPYCVNGFGSRKGRRFVKKKGVSGYLGEDPACAEVNSGIFDAWKQTGDVMAAVFGHDHMNDFVGKVEGIDLCQCKTAGFHVYTDGCNAGVRMFTFSENDVRGYDTRMVRFKELGLKSLSLGPVMRNFTDRQVINIHTLTAAGVPALTAAAAAVTIRYLRHK